MFTVNTFRGPTHHQISTSYNQPFESYQLRTHFGTFWFYLVFIENVLPDSTLPPIMCTRSKVVNQTNLSSLYLCLSLLCMIMHSHSPLLVFGGKSFPNHWYANRLLTLVYSSSWGHSPKAFDLSLADACFFA